MTEGQVREGIIILDKIEDYEKEIEAIEKLSEYIDSKESTKSVEIQVHEPWISTPYAKVNKTNLIQFLNTEKHRVELIILSLRERLETI